MSDEAQIELLSRLRGIARFGASGAAAALARLEAAFECRCDSESACDKCAVQCRCLNPDPGRPLPDHCGIDASDRKPFVAGAPQPVAIGAYHASDCQARLRGNTMADCLDCPEDCDRAIEIRDGARASR